VRGLLAAVIGVTMPALIVTAAPASAVDDTVTLRSVEAVTPGRTTPIEVALTSSSDITSAVAVVRPYGQGQVVAISTLEPVSGTPRDGVWRTKTAVTVPEGRMTISLEGYTATNHHWSFPAAGLIDNGRDATVSAFTADPTAIDSEHTNVTFHGRVTWHPADGPEEGVPGIRVHVFDGSVDLRLVRTDDQGSFVGSAHIFHTTRIHAVADADAMYRSATSDEIEVTHRALPTRLTVTAPAAGSAVVGEPMVLTGRLERQRTTGEWTGLEALVTAAPADQTSPAVTLVTGSDGTYRAEVTPASASAWTVSLPDGNYAGSTARTDVVPVRRRAQLTGFTIAPDPVGRGAPLTVRGRVLRKTASGALAAAPDATVRLQFSADAKTWATTSARTVPDAHGDFTVAATAARDGYWRAAVVDDGDYLAAVGGSKHVVPRTPTRIGSFNASPEPVRKGRTITVTGRLQRHTSAWTNLAGQSVKISFRADGATTWTYKGTAKTGRTGLFSRAFTASKDGTWRAAFAGSTTYIAVTGPGDHVDVR
jgi:hypothetical protein